MLVRIDIVTKEFPPEIYGGAGVHVAELSRVLSKHVDLQVRAFGAPRDADYHGWADALVPPEHVTALAQELTAAGCDWQIHCYGGAEHGFTHARPPKESLPVNALADKRAWASAAAFLAECFA